MQEIDWSKVYEGTIHDETGSTVMWGEDEHTKRITSRNKKFDVPIGLIPWSDDYAENVALTLEWLIRDHRKDMYRLKPESLLTHTREFWYHSEYDEGGFMHVCFPPDMLKFRHKYEERYTQWHKLPSNQMSSNSIDLLKHCKSLLWAQWRCIGNDGMGDKFTGEKAYKYRCSRCSSDMPKGVKMYALLTRSKLKDI